MKKKVKPLPNFWMEMPNRLRFQYLDKAIKAGILKKEFVEEIKNLYRKKKKTK